MIAKSKDGFDSGDFYFLPFDALLLVFCFSYVVWFIAATYFIGQFDSSTSWL